MQPENRQHRSWTSNSIKQRQQPARQQTAWGARQQRVSQVSRRQQRQCCCLGPDSPGQQALLGAGAPPHSSTSHRHRRYNRYHLPGRTHHAKQITLTFKSLLCWSLQCIGVYTIFQVALFSFFSIKCRPLKLIHINVYFITVDSGQ